MSQNRVTEIGQAKVRGGIEVSAYKRSARGTRYRAGSIVVLRGEKTKPEMNEAVASAVLEISGTLE